MIKFPNLKIAVLLLLMASSAQANAENIYDGYHPLGYVAICKIGNQTIVEPYETFEARLARGWTPFAPRSSTLSNIIEEMAKRLEPFARTHAAAILTKTRGLLDGAKFLDKIDIVPENDETIPPALQRGCEVKKLFSFNPPHLPYAFVFDVSLWNALSDFGKAVTSVNIALSLPCPEYSCDTLSDLDPASIRRFTTLVFSSAMPKMTARDWFTELKGIGISWVLYKGYPLGVDGAEFYDQTGSIKKTVASSYGTVEIAGKPVYLNGPIEFYANGTVRSFTPSNSYTGQSNEQDGLEFLGGRGLLTGECAAELSEDQKLVQACFKNWTKVKTDRYLLTVNGHMSFHPSGYVEKASGVGLVELNGKIVEVSSGRWSDNLSFDEAGNVMSGTLASRAKFRDISSGSEFELEAFPFTAYPGGRIKSGRLAKDAKLKDCTGAVQLFPAKTDITFNEAGFPCGSPK
ncbi:MAG: hypothetical protein ACJ763_11635 [Bdellovibrionia bacterium]